MYILHLFKDGSAKGVIEGLSCSGAYYDEAIVTVKARYDHI